MWLAKPVDDIILASTYVELPVLINVDTYHYQRIVERIYEEIS
jgi:hypothetical protein